MIHMNYVMIIYSYMHIILIYITLIWNIFHIFVSTIAKIKVVMWIGNLIISNYISKMYTIVYLC